MGGGKGEQIHRGGISTSDSDDANLHDVLTVFQRADARRCTVGGKIQWSHNDMRHGIHMTLEELLACADVHLDAPPRIRTMGLALHLRLHYQESFVGRMTCRITVTPALGWTRAPPSSDFVRLPVGSGTAKRTRRAH